MHLRDLDESEQGEAIQVKRLRATRKERAKRRGSRLGAASEH
jgi:hypothetical protein